MRKVPLPLAPANSPVPPVSWYVPEIGPERMQLWVELQVIGPGSDRLVQRALAKVKTPGKGTTG
ncbi:MAG: hypothetical protein ACRD2W_02965 [Acidimicrobiales bacterium]